MDRLDRPLLGSLSDFDRVGVTLVSLASENKNKMPTKVSPSNSSGKIIQMNNHDVIVEIVPRGAVYNIEKIYKPTGEPISEGDLVSGRPLTPAFYDELYQDIDEEQYFELG